MVTVLMMTAKIAALGLLKIIVFWNKSYDVIICIYDVTNIILLRGSNYTVDVIMWPKFGYSSISIKEVIINSILLKGFDQKNRSWFKFNDWGVALGIALTFYTSVAKELKLKLKECWRLNPTFVEVTWEKQLNEPSPFPHPG